jgi:hypothetical protein
VLLRLPASLHEQAALAAAREGVSLNQFICSLLAGGVKWDPNPTERGAPKSTEELVFEGWNNLSR